MWVEYSFDAPMTFLARTRQGIEKREGARRRQRRIPFDGWLLYCEPLVRTVYIESIEGNSSLLELACLTRCWQRHAPFYRFLIDGLRLNVNLSISMTLRQ
jgi:hypothetical protein